MPMTILTLTALASFAIGFAASRWWAALAAGALWPAHFAGITLGLWGAGVGDGWPYALAVGTATAVIGALAGVVAGHHYRRRGSRPVGIRPGHS